MKKLALIIPAALLLSGCILFPSRSTTLTGTEAQKAEKLAQIMSRGGQADCQVTNLTDQSSTRFVISGKKMKFMGSSMGGGKAGTMLNDGVYTYIWTDGEKTGFKTKIEPEVSPTPGGTTETVDPIETVRSYDDETKFKTDCTGRTISDSEFTPPADVVFTDFGEMMKNVPKIPSIPAYPTQGSDE